MAEFNLNRFKYTWKGDWQSGQEYNRDDVISIQGKSFVCLIQHVSSSAFFDDLYADSVIYSGCGEDVILRANSSLSVSSPVDGDTALIELDSFDYKNQQYRTLFDYQFTYEKCS